MERDSRWLERRTAPWVAYALALRVVRELLRVGLGLELEEVVVEACGDVDDGESRRTEGKLSEDRPGVRCVCEFGIV